LHFGVSSARIAAALRNGTRLAASSKRFTTPRAALEGTVTSHLEGLPRSSLAGLGWSDFFGNQILPDEASALPVRIAAVHRPRITGISRIGRITLLLPTHTNTGDIAVGHVSDAAAGIGESFAEIIESRPALQVSRLHSRPLNRLRGPRRGV